MQEIALILLFLQQPVKPESTLWLYRTGQEFFIEETQRQLVQIRGSTQVSSYFDITYLWRYQIQAEQDGEVKIQATLEKVRVNNLNEAGGRASERLKLQEGTRSNWQLKKGGTGWEIKRALEDSTIHATPLILTLGTKHLDQDLAGWKQQWSMPKTELGYAQLELAMTVRQQTAERLSVNNRGKLIWKADSNTNAKVSVIPESSSTMGLGEFDISKGRWLYFEWRAEGNWQVTSAGVNCTMKQSQYCNYRFYDRKPTFP